MRLCHSCEGDNVLRSATAPLVVIYKHPTVRIWICELELDQEPLSNLEEGFPVETSSSRLFQLTDLKKPSAADVELDLG